MRHRWVLGLALATSPAVLAQPVTAPGDAPLADIRDEAELARVLASLTQDPAVKVSDPKARPVAQALMTEGVKQLHAHRYEQALANFLEAYATFPSPKILLNIGSTLRDMGRPADAANTYQRYLTDPATGPERVEEVKKLLVELDQQLTVLAVRVTPRGSDVSIDGGPFIPVGTALVTRVRPGLHLVRIRNGEQVAEQTVNGFEGEIKDVLATLPEASPTPGTTTKEPPSATVPTTTGTSTTTAGTGAGSTASTGVRPLPTVRTPEEQYGWLDTGTQYGTSDPTSSSRQVRSGWQGPVVRASLPEPVQFGDELEVEDEDPGAGARRIRSGAIGLLRIDGKGRGVAGGLGLALAPLDTVELELAALRSKQWGGYAGLRVRFLTGWIRPYIAGGLPVFLFEDENDAMRTKVALGVRAAGGVELRINGHLSVKGDVGMERFFSIDEDALVGGARPERTVFVPTLGVIGRL